MAIMSRATPENLFVGYARAFRSADGVIGYHYFDCYPFFFSAFVGTLINLFDALPTQVFVARQVMNAICVATLLFAYLLINKLLYSRDIMIHYHQPALTAASQQVYARTIDSICAFNEHTEYDERVRQTIDGQLLDDCVYLIS